MSDTTSPFRTALLLSALLVIGCGSDQSSASSQPQASNQNEHPAATSEPASYEVHEWGLATGSIGGGAVRLQALPVPAPAPPPMSTRAPILYVRLLGETESVTFSATVQIPGGGSITEHWPAAEAVDHGVRWTDVRAARGSCSGAYPDEQGARCSGVTDGHCEAARLAPLEASDAACLTVAGEPYNHLFYRGAVGSPTLPLTLQADAAGAVLVTNGGTETVGSIVRVVRGPTTTLVTMVPMPGQSQSVSVPRPTTADDLPRARQSVGVALRELGMTDAEAQAFERAWLSELFDPQMTAVRELTRRGPMRDVPPQDFVLYWLPEASANELATLTFDPEPAAVRRAFLVRVEL